MAEEQSLHYCQVGRRGGCYKTTVYELQGDSLLIRQEENILNVKKRQFLGRFIITRSPESDGSSYDIDRLNGCHMIIYLIFSCVLESLV